MKLKKWLSKLSMDQAQEPALTGGVPKQTTSFEYDLYKSLLSHHPDGIILFDSNGSVIDCNKRISSILGHPLEDLRKDFFRVVDEQGLKTALRNFKRALEGQTVHYTDKRMKEDGLPFHIQVLYMPFRVEDVIYGVIGVFRDYNSVASLETQLAGVQRIASIGTWDYYPLEERVQWNDQFCEIIGVKDKGSVSPSIGKFKSIIHPDDRENFDKALNAALQQSTCYELEFCIVKLGGEIITCYMKAETFVNSQGKVNYLTGIIQDVTEKKKKEQLNAAQKEQTENILQAMDAAVWSFDVQENKLLFCSETIFNIYGVPADKFLKEAEYWKELVHPDDQKRVEDISEQIANGYKVNIEYRIIQPSGKVKWVDRCTIPVFDEKGKLIRIDGIITDISYKKEFERSIDYITHNDSLTGLPNRKTFEKELSAALERAKASKKMLSLFSIDLDGFRNINNALGHDVGDKLIIEMSRYLQDICGKQTFLARLGGDEFGIFIENISGMDVSIELAHKILQIFKEPFMINSYELHVTASIGITYAPFDGEDLLILLKNADTAMYRAKESGKNDYYVYTPVMNVEAFKRYSLEKGLRSALENNEFYLEYQPKVNAKTEEVEGAEALIRWQHPEWGVVSPAEFMPLAEDSGYMLSIGDWVIKQVCLQIKKWENKGLDPVPVSINVSYKRLVKKNFVENVLHAVHEAGIHPSYIEFEITERTTYQNEGAVQEVLQELQAWEFRFSLDDFGTCQSSLSYLCHFDIDAIKIDRSLIKEIGVNRRIETIVSSLITACNELGVGVVAEGVETELQLEYLRERNCPLIQGYLFSRPISVDSFEELLLDPQIRLHPKSDKLAFTGKDRRTHERLSFPNPVIGAMTITKIKGQKVNIGFSDILIGNICDEGMLFLSKISLPEQQDILLKITFAIGAKDFELLGTLRWKQEEAGLYRYGVNFQMKNDERENLANLIAYISREWESSGILSGFNTFIGSPDEFFYKTK